MVLVYKQLRNYFLLFKKKEDGNTPILLLRRHTKDWYFVEFERVKSFVKKEVVYIENKKETS